MKNFTDRYYKETLNNSRPTLINKFNIRDVDELEEVELDLSIENLFILSQNPIDGDWDYRHLAKYHKHVFGDLYEWAGSLRKFGVVKPEAILGGRSVEYADPLMAVPMADYYLNKFKTADLTQMTNKEQTELFCESLVGVWQSHPFNEGNTRVITRFMVDLAEHKGLHINSMLFGEHSDYFRLAMVAYTYDKTEYLTKIVGEAIEDGNLGLIPTNDLPIHVYNFVKGNLDKKMLENKKFKYNNEIFRILNLEKTRGKSQAEAIIINEDTQKAYLESNFAGEIPFNLKLKQEINPVSTTIMKNTNIQE